MAPSFDEFDSSSIETPKTYIDPEGMIETSSIKLENTMKEILPQEQYEEFKKFLSLLRPEAMKTLVEGTLYGKDDNGSNFWLIPYSVRDDEKGNPTASFTLIKNKGDDDAQVLAVQVITPKGEKLLHRAWGIISRLPTIEDSDTQKSTVYKAPDSPYEWQGTIQHYGAQYLHRDGINLREKLLDSRETIQKAQEEKWFPFTVVTVQQLADAFNGDDVREVQR